MDTETIIQVKNLTHYYSDFKALDDINFEIPNNQVVGLLGPNGAGKTTLINILCTLIKPTKGEVKVLGYDAIRNPKHIRPLLGFIPQSNATLDVNLTVFNNLRFFSMLNLNNSKKEVHEILELFGLESVKDKFTYQLSGGMVRRLILARLGLSNCRIIFLDEPTVGLDVNSKALFGEFIHEMQTELNVNILIATHDLAEAENLCDQVIILDKGQILSNISLDDIKAKYLKKVFVQFANPINSDEIKKIALVDPKTIMVNPQNIISFLLRSQLKSFNELVGALEGIGPINSITIDDISLEEYFKITVNANHSID